MSSQNQDVFYTQTPFINIFPPKIKTKWTKQQENLLLKLNQQYSGDIKQISHFLNRSIGSCQLKIRRLLKVHQKTKKQAVKFKYSQIQDKCILDLYKKYPQNWNQIASHFHNRQKLSLQIRYKHLNNVKLVKINKEWTKEEDQLLLQSVKILQYNWQNISQLFQNVDSNICYTRHKSLISKESQTFWKYQQENKLLELYDRYPEDWEKISEQLENKRSPQGCLKRFIKLKLLSQQKKWQQIEIQLLLQKYQIHQPNWIQIHKYFPNFTQRDCFFKYHSIRRKNQVFQQRSIALKYAWKSRNYRQKKPLRKVQYANFWTFSDDDLLLNFVNQGFINWQQISKKFGYRRTSTNCQKRYKFLESIKLFKSTRIWTEQQIWRLNLFGYAQTPRFNLGFIFKNFVNCTKEDCYIKYRQMMQNDDSLKKSIYNSEKKRLQDFYQKRIQFYENPNEVNEIQNQVDCKKLFNQKNEINNEQEYKQYFCKKRKKVNKKIKLNNQMEQISNQKQKQ